MSPLSNFRYVNTLRSFLTSSLFLWAIYSGAKIYSLNDNHFVLKFNIWRGKCPQFPFTKLSKSTSALLQCPTIIMLFHRIHLCFKEDVVKRASANPGWLHEGTLVTHTASVTADTLVSIPTCQFLSTRLPGCTSELQTLAALLPFHQVPGITSLSF